MGTFTELTRSSFQRLAVWISAKARAGGKGGIGSSRISSGKALRGGVPSQMSGALCCAQGMSFSRSNVSNCCTATEVELATVFLCFALQIKFTRKTQKPPACLGGGFYWGVVWLLIFYNFKNRYFTIADGIGKTFSGGLENVARRAGRYFKAGRESDGTLTTYL